MSEDFLYHYTAKVTECYDGDTITVDIDLGFGIWMRDQKIRLFGIDTPEMRGVDRVDGIIVRDLVRDILIDKTVTLKTERDASGKYGCWLATVIIDGMDLNQMLLDEGHAEEYLK